MVNRVLEKLALTLTVQDIMTPTKDLERANSYERARIHHNKYDNVPYPTRGAIRGYFKRSLEKIQMISSKILLSDSTSILDLPKLLEKHHYYFIISGNSITGYLHFSDLNKTIAKIPFYTLLQNVERKLWENISTKISERDLQEIFNENEIKRFKKIHEKNKKENVNISWVGVFSFKPIFKIARFYYYINLNDDEINLLTEIRNRVSHSDRNLLTKKDDLSDLVKACQIVMSLLKSK